MSYTIAGDIHTHTLFSRHAYSTIAENVAAARAVGLEVLGSADHFSCMLFPEQHIRNFQFFINQGVWPRVWDGVTVLRGMEADIVSLSGEIFGQDIPCRENITGRPFRTERSLFDQVVRGLDYVVASVHNGDFTEGASLAATTAMYVKAHLSFGGSGGSLDMHGVIVSRAAALHAKSPERGRASALRSHPGPVCARVLPAPAFRPLPRPPAPASTSRLLLSCICAPSVPSQARLDTIGVLYTHAYAPRRSREVTSAAARARLHSASTSRRAKLLSVYAAQGASGFSS